nr:MAG TPA: Head protein [Caudoviricetes sp.]
MGSTDLHTRIGTATEQNIGNIGTTILNYSVVKNEFLNVLVNKICGQIFMNKVYTNPLSFFEKEPVPYGSTLESVFTDLIQSKNFNENFGTNDVSSLIGVETPPSKTEYYSKNFAKKYKISVSDLQLRTAFLNPNGLQNLINQVLTVPTNSRNFDDFQLMKGLLANASTKEVTLATTYKTANDDVKAKMLTKQTRAIVDRFGMMSKIFNIQGVYTFTNSQNIVIITTPEVSANLDVELLATAFNMEKAEMGRRIVKIDSFQKYNATTKAYEADANVELMVIDEDYIQFRRTLQVSESFRNPDKLTTNVFTHNQGIGAICGFVNAVKILNSARA